MAIRFSCPGCGATLNAPDGWQGKKGNCKKCGGRFVIQSPSAVTAEAIKKAFSFPIQRRPPTLGYNLSLVGVAFLMLLLPLIYLCLVGAVGAAGLAYGYYGLSIFDGSAPPGGSRGHRRSVRAIG